LAHSHLLRAPALSIITRRLLRVTGTEGTVIERITAARPVTRYKVEPAHPTKVLSVEVEGGALITAARPATQYKAETAHRTAVPVARVTITVERFGTLFLYYSRRREPAG
jgi:hypothetical protein